MEALRSHRDDRRWHLMLIVLLVLPLYVLNARWSVHGNPDVIAAALPAYEVANNTSLDVSDYQVIRDNLDRGLATWFLTLPDGRIVSNRPPGLIGIAVPSYIVTDQIGFSNGPATMVALVTTFLAVVLTWDLLIKIIGLRAATIAALTLALGTTTWWVSSSELWPHGPGQLCAALAITALAQSRNASAGLAYAAAITVRPLTGLFAVITGGLESARERSIFPALKIAGVASLGVAAVVLYNRWLFGSWSLRGGYSEAFTSGAVDSFDLGAYLANVYEMFVGLPNGVLITTPILGVALMGVILARGLIPGWAKSTALAGVGYLLVHAALNRASGGSLVFYRYPLESIVLASPALAIGAMHLWRSGIWWKRAVWFAGALSIALQFLHVFYLSCFITDPPVTSCLFA